MSSSIPWRFFVALSAFDYCFARGCWYRDWLNTRTALDSWTIGISKMWWPYWGYSSSCGRCTRFFYRVIIDIARPIIFDHDIIVLLFEINRSGRGSRWCCRSCTRCGGIGDGCLGGAHFERCSSYSTTMCSHIVSCRIVRIHDYSEVWSRFWFLSGGHGSPEIVFLRWRRSQKQRRGRWVRQDCWMSSERFGIRWCRGRRWW